MVTELVARQISLLSLAVVQLSVPATRGIQRVLQMDILTKIFFTSVCHISSYFLGLLQM